MFISNAFIGFVTFYVWSEVLRTYLSFRMILKIPRIPLRILWPSLLAFSLYYKHFFQAKMFFYETNCIASSCDFATVRAGGPPRRDMGKVASLSLGGGRHTVTSSLQGQGSQESLRKGPATGLGMEGSGRCGGGGARLSLSPRGALEGVLPHRGGWSREDRRLGWAATVTGSRDQGHGPGICGRGPSRAGAREQPGNADSRLSVLQLPTLVLLTGFPFGPPWFVLCLTDAWNAECGTVLVLGVVGTDGPPHPHSPPSHVQRRPAPLCSCPWLPSVRARTRQAPLGPRQRWARLHPAPLPQAPTHSRFSLSSFPRE